MFSSLYNFCLHFYLINMHIFDYPDSRLSGLFTAVPACPDNRGSTVLCLGISIITWVIILEQLFASGSWILVNIPLDFTSGNIQQYSLRLRRIIIKCSVLVSKYIMSYHRFCWYASLEIKIPAETFPKFPLILRVIYMSDRNRVRYIMPA